MSWIWGRGGCMPSPRVWPYPKDFLFILNQKKSPFESLCGAAINYLMFVSICSLVEKRWP